MKKHIIIDDNGISGYGSIEQIDNIYVVSFEVKSMPDNPNIAQILAYIINGSNTFSIGDVKQMGGGISLRKLYEKDSFFDFDPDLPTKIKFRVELGENVDVIDQSVTEDDTDDSKETPKISSSLSKYLRQYDIFCDSSFSDVVWYRVHDGEILIDNGGSKRIFENYAVLALLNELKHYLIGFDDNGEVYYAFPARFGVEKNPFGTDCKYCRWLAVYGQSEKFGNFGYYVVKANALVSEPA